LVVFLIKKIKKIAKKVPAKSNALKRGLFKYALEPFINKEKKAPMKILKIKHGIIPN
jgi:hypothetical protein